jgi:hypothetical protein
MHGFRPASAVNISGMSFGSLSGNAVTVLNRGAKAAGCLQTAAKAGCRRTTARAATSSSRSVRRTSAVVTSAQPERVRHVYSRFAGLITADDIDVVDGLRASQRIREVYGYEPGWGELGPALKEEVVAMMSALLPEPETPPTR